MTLGCKDIEIRKSEFVAKGQFLLLQQKGFLFRKHQTKSIEYEIQM